MSLNYCSYFMLYVSITLLSAHKESVQICKGVYKAALEKSMKTLCTSEKKLCICDQELNPTLQRGRVAVFNDRLVQLWHQPAEIFLFIHLISAGQTARWCDQRWKSKDSCRYGECCIACVCVCVSIVWMQHAAGVSLYWGCRSVSVTMEILNCVNTNTNCVNHSCNPPLQESESTHTLC